jgi:hypothetical protein
MVWAIKFRPIKPRSPQLNGKVERAQRTALEELWSWAAPKAVDLGQQLQEWPHHYIWERAHTASAGITPIDRCRSLFDKTPFHEEVAANFDPANERIRVQHYPSDRALGRFSARLTAELAAAPLSQGDFNRRARRAHP